MSELLQTASRIDNRVVLIALLLVLDLWSMGMTLASRASRREKMLWSAVILFCPIFGCLFWFSLGPKPDLTGRAGSPSRRGET